MRGMTFAILAAVCLWAAIYEHDERKTGNSPDDRLFSEGGGIAFVFMLVATFIAALWFGISGG